MRTFFHTIVRPSRGNSWLSHNFYVAELAQQRLLWIRIRGFGDAIYVRIRYMGISQYALLCSAADAFSHGFEWMTHKVLFIFSCVLFLRHFYECLEMLSLILSTFLPPPSPFNHFFLFFCFFFCILCDSALGLFMRNATHSFLPVQLRPLFVCYCFANSSGQNAHTHTHTHSRTHGDMAGKPFSTQICSISNGSTTISVFFSPRFSVAFFLTASC